MRKRVVATTKPVINAGGLPKGKKKKILLLEMSFQIDVPHVRGIQMPTKSAIWRSVYLRTKMVQPLEY